MLTITGTNLATIKEPKMRAKYGAVKSENVSVSTQTLHVKKLRLGFASKTSIYTRECVCLCTASHSEKADFQMMHTLSGL